MSLCTLSKDSCGVIQYRTTKSQRHQGTQRFRKPCPNWHTCLPKPRRRQVIKLPNYQIVFTYFLSNFTARIIRQIRKMSKLSRLMPCMYPIHLLFGLDGSFFLRKRYSAS